ncbi:unnamed protein product [Calicophoron daubneyi]|uniref:RING-type domain-containing protein n=1 Tax=Calicophoron daubneyi TaxID=300641 RepID=A0AAV2T6W9_CALDB
MTEEFSVQVDEDDRKFVDVATRPFSPPHAHVTVNSSTYFLAPPVEIEPRTMAVQTDFTAEQSSQTEGLRERSPSPPPLVVEQTQSIRVSHVQENNEEEEERRRVFLNQQRILLSLLPMRTVNEAYADRHQKCAVCFEEYKCGDQAMTLPCFHVLHQLCGIRWFLEQPGCPLCRRHLTELE